MSNKEFLPYTTIRDNGLKLAAKLHQSGFVPDVIYVSLRGGAFLGNIISEYFKMVRTKQDRPVFYAAVVARSYTGVREQEEIKIDGWTYKPEYLRTGDKILLIDDIFDSGRTLNHLTGILLSKGIPRDDIKVVVHDYKIRLFEKIQPAIRPDFYCRKFVLEQPADDKWIHYLSHELVGLDTEEIEAQYEDPEVQTILKQLIRD